MQPITPYPTSCPCLVRLRHFLSPLPSPPFPIPSYSVLARLNVSSDGQKAWAAADSFSTTLGVRRLRWDAKTGLCAAARAQLPAVNM